jgi:hypothetical protein
VSANSGATPRLRVDREATIHQLQAFLHTHQPNAREFRRIVKVKTASRILYNEINRIRRFEELYFELFRSAVLHRISQRFLEDSEKTKRDLSGQI